MDVGERVFDLGAEPVKGTAKGAWGGLKKGAVALGVIGAVIPLAVFGVAFWPVVGALALGGAGLAAGGVFGAPVGGAIGGLGGAFTGVRKFIFGRDREPGSTESQLQALRQQSAFEEAQTAAYQRQQQRTSSMEGANPAAATDNAAKLAARHMEAAARATGGRA